MILLTGATGNTGSAIARELSARGVPFVAMARSSARRRELTERGLEVVAGDFDDPKSLASALEGIERAYLVSTPDETLMRREGAFIDAAKKAGVRHIVKCSAYLADESSESPNLRSHGVVERALRDSGMAWTILRPHGFMQTFTLFSWDLVREAGVISAPHGEGKMPLVDVRDVAALAVKALTEPGHEGKLYEITGPQALGMWDMAELLERALHRPVSFVEGDAGSMEVVMKILGVPETPRKHVEVIAKLVRERRVERVHDTLREQGITPTTYEQFLEDWIAGRAGSGNSFKPPNTAVVRALTFAMPKLMRLRIKLLGRPRRPN
ncbi:MAG: SDR family oxidoreductase [Polyangiaceae bacterium]